MSPVLLLVRRTAAAAWVLGGLLAAWDLSQRTHVREFQSGPPSDLGERLGAWVQRTAIESVGFAAVALLVGLVAVLLARGERRRAFGTAFCLGGGLWAWARHGAHYGEELVPFLGVGGLVLLNLLGWGAPGAAAVVGAALSRRLPPGRGADPALAGLGAGLVVALGSELWREAVRSGGLQSAGSLGAVAGVAVALPLVSAPLGALLGRLGALAANVGPVRRTLAALARAEARTVPLAVGSTLLVALVLREGPPTPESPSYPRIESERAADAAPAGGPRNVVLILVDTLRADALGCYGYERPTSPRMDALAAGGTLFTDVTSPAAWTKPATASLLTGLWPSRHGALKHGSSLRTPEGELALAEVFQAAGFATAGFVSNPNVKRVFDFDRGFDEFFDSPVEDTVTAAAIRDSVLGRLLIATTRHQFNWKYANDVFAMNRHVTAWLRSNADQDFFLYVHYIDPHTPYSPPARWRREFERDHPGLPLHVRRRELVGRDLYDAEVRTSDEGLGELFDVMEELGLLDETLIAITSDHGEEFNEKGMFEHGYSIYQAEVFVPLILAGPGVAARRVEQPVNTVHLPATLLELAGVVRGEGGGPATYGDGRSLAPLVREEAGEVAAASFVENQFNMSQAPVPDFVHTGMRLGSYKLILTEKSKFRPIDRYPFEELYDLSSDPGEERNLFYEPEHEDLVRRMTDLLKAHALVLERTGLGDGGTVELTPELKRQLQALGYLLDD